MGVGVGHSSNGGRVGTVDLPFLFFSLSFFGVVGGVRTRSLSVFVLLAVFLATVPGEIKRIISKEFPDNLRKLKKIITF